MKKFYLLLVVSVLGLSACAPSETSNEEIGGELTVVTSYTDAEEKFADVEAGFKEKYPEVTDITWESSENYDEYITTRMTTGEYGDVLFVPFSLTRELEELPNFLESLGTEDELSEEWTFTDQAAFEGETYAMPISVNSLGMMYNEEVFEEAGAEIPTSTEETLEACQAITDSGKQCWYSNINTLSALWSGGVTSYGGEQYESEMLEAGTAFAEDQPYRQILDFINEMITSGYAEADPITGDLMTSMQQVASGEVGFIIMGSQSLADVQAMSDNPETIKMAPFPVTYEGEQHMAFGADELIGVSNKSENSATAKAFVEYLVSSESGFAYTNGGFAPEVDGNKDAPESIAYQIEDYDSIRTIATEDAETIDKFNAIGNEANMASITGPISELLEVTTNDGDYDQLITDLEADWNAAVENYEK